MTQSSKKSSKKGSTKSKNKINYDITDVWKLKHHLMVQNRKVRFDADVDSYTIYRVISDIEYLSSLNTKPITLEIHSYGGGCDAGIVLYDFMKASKVKIYTKCAGICASMAAVILAAGEKGHRSVTKNSRIMIHQPSSGFRGKASDIEIQARETSKIKRRLTEMLAYDTGQKFDKVAKDMELDHWMDANEAIKYGLVDNLE